MVEDRYVNVVVHGVFVVLGFAVVVACVMIVLRCLLGGVWLFGELRGVDGLVIAVVR